MLKRIEKPTVRKRFWQKMREADGMVKHQSYTRTIKTIDGTKTVEYLMKPHELERTKIERVFNTVLNWYTDHYNKMHSIMPSFYEDGKLPELKTTNPEIGHSAGCSDRTARTMLTMLVDMGVIVKTSKGSRGGINLRFTEAFLWGSSEKKEQDFLPQNVCPPIGYGKKFPHNNTYREDSEKETISGVGVVDKDRMENREGDNRVTQFLGKNDPEPQYEPLSERKKGAAAAAPNVDNSVENSEHYSSKRHTKAEREAHRKAVASENQRLRQVATTAQNDSSNEWQEKCKQAVMYFWAVSHEKLYAGRQYDTETVRIILRLIWTDVFGSFQGIRNETELAHFMARALAKIEKAAIYFDRNPNAYLPDPHSIMVNGKGYFDKANYRGFAGLEAWMKADENKNAKLRADLLNPRAFKERKTVRLLAQARKDFQKIRAGAVRRVEVQHLDMVGLMQYYTVIFQNLGIDALQRFNKQVLEMQRVGFRPDPKPQKGKTPLIVEVDSWMASFGNDY